MTGPAGGVNADRRQAGARTYAEVMTVPAPEPASPFEAAELEFVFGEVWTRPGLARKQRRLISLSCVAAADATQPIRDHVWAALKSGDLTFDEVQETVLHFAVYCGWPKGSFFQQVVGESWARLHEERGLPVPPAPPLELAAPDDTEQRLAGGEREFIDVNVTPGAPPRTAPYNGAGILNFVFGEMWQRPGLTRTERRYITVACVALDDTRMPIKSHVFSALKSGQIGIDEMQELVLHFAVHSGWPKASFLQAVVAEQWAAVERGEPHMVDEI